MTINTETASSTLKKAYKESLESNSSCVYKDFIDYVMLNTHITYKYVLFTAILAKATDPSINPLCLQKKSMLKGSYDARSICHKVIVPFEMETLNKALGGSNEPFLNKPARFPELSKDNAVRNGNDREILLSLCENLPKISTKDIAYSCLVYLLKLLTLVGESRKSDNEFTIENGNNSKVQLLNFIQILLKQSFEGETLTLVVAGLYKLLYEEDSNYFIDVHPVNQSGASSKEISDLDVYHNKKIILFNELKDKDFTHIDIKHAADKVIKSGGDHLQFIVGNFGKVQDTVDAGKLINHYQQNGFIICIVPISFFIRQIIILTKSVSVELFLKYIVHEAQNKKFKQATIRFIIETAKSLYELDIVS